MTETYTSGVWIVNDGEEEDFIREWADFVGWASGFSGSGTFRLVRDLDHPRRYLSFAPWDSFDAQHTWKEQSEFRERLSRIRRHCEEFRPATLELVTQVG